MENALCWKEPSPTGGKWLAEESGTDFLPLPFALTMPGFLQLLIMMITVFLVCVCVCLCTRVQRFLAEPLSVGHCQMVQKLTGISFSNKPQTWMS